MKRGSAAAELPGKIQFEFKPEVVKAGDQYSVSIYLLNEGAASISVKTMAVSIVKNGGRAGGPVQPQTKDVAPRQKACSCRHRPTSGRKTRLHGRWTSR